MVQILDAKAGASAPENGPHLDDAVRVDIHLCIAEERGHREPDLRPVREGPDVKYVAASTGETHRPPAPIIPAEVRLVLQHDIGTPVRPGGVDLRRDRD